MHGVSHDLSLLRWLHSVSSSSPWTLLLPIDREPHIITYIKPIFTRSVFTVRSSIRYGRYLFAAWIASILSLSWSYIASKTHRRDTHTHARHATCCVRCSNEVNFVPLKCIYKTSKIGNITQTALFSYLKRFYASYVSLRRPTCPSPHFCISVVLAYWGYRDPLFNIYSISTRHTDSSIYTLCFIVEATAIVCHGTFQGHTSYIPYVQSVHTSAFANKLEQIEFEKWTSVVSISCI